MDNIKWAREKEKLGRGDVAREYSISISTSSGVLSIREYSYRNTHPGLRSSPKKEGKNNLAFCTKNDICSPKEHNWFPFFFLLTYVIYVNQLQYRFSLLKFI